MISKLSMRLEDLIEGLRTATVAGDCEINGLTCDSREVRKGDLFFAVRGGRFDGNEFIEDAITRGANAVLSEKPPTSEVGVPYVRVEDINTAMARIADRFYGHPSGKMKVIGITGTNGKTTTSYIARNILTGSGIRTGLIGTIKYILGAEALNGILTTPEAIEFQMMLARMYDGGITHAVTEVSSHALSLKRVDFTDFQFSVFTNLTRDHLDFHGDIETYYRAKRRLFIELTRSAAIINIDDPYGKRLVDEIRGLGSQKSRVHIITYGLCDEAALRATEIKESFEGLSFFIKHRDDSVHITSPLLGITNAYNILSAIGISVASGITWDRIIEGVRQFSGIEGRMESVKAGQDFLAIVDYAHTPDALQKVIQTLRRLTEGRIITVFGCGGDRDRGKRPEMGRIATELSDRVIVTSDNPRTEEPMNIIDGIIKGIKKGNYLVETDRKSAIRKAVRMAGSGDVVLVAGKGHEDYQEIQGRRYPFSDRAVLKEAIRRIADNRLEIVDSPDSPLTKGGLKRGSGIRNPESGFTR